MTGPIIPGDQSWVFIGRTDVEAETPILWPPDAKSWHIWKDPAAGKDWGQEEKGMTEDEMVGWHHQLNRHEFGWTLGVGDGQGGLVCCGSRGRKESDMTERLNWTDMTCIWSSLVSTQQVFVWTLFVVIIVVFLAWSDSWVSVPLMIHGNQAGDVSYLRCCVCVSASFSFQTHKQRSGWESAPVPQDRPCCSPLEPTDGIWFGKGSLHV